MTFATCDASGGAGHESIFGPKFFFRPDSPLRVRSAPPGGAPAALPQRLAGTSTRAFPMAKSWSRW